MTVACRLCGELVMHSEAALTAALASLPIGDENRAAIEYQATVQAFAQHVGQRHQEYVMTLATTAQVYHFHLIAKLALSAAPDFVREREAARNLCYWTLAGEFAIESKPIPLARPKAPPIS